MKSSVIKFNSRLSCTRIEWRASSAVQSCIAWMSWLRRSQTSHRNKIKRRGVAFLFYYVSRWRVKFICCACPHFVRVVKKFYTWATIGDFFFLSLSLLKLINLTFRANKNVDSCCRSKLFSPPATKKSFWEILVILFWTIKIFFRIHSHFFLFLSKHFCEKDLSFQAREMQTPTRSLGRRIIRSLIRFFKLTLKNK